MTSCEFDSLSSCYRKTRKFFFSECKRKEENVGTKNKALSKHADKKEQNIIILKQQPSHPSENQCKTSQRFVASCVSALVAATNRPV